VNSPLVSPIGLVPRPRSADMRQVGADAIRDLAVEGDQLLVFDIVELGHLRLLTASWTAGTGTHRLAG